MKVLLTGGTGFLGKHVLEKLVERKEISRIIAVSRRKSTHPSPKVRVLSADLASPSFVNDLDEAVDAVIHLAGLYQFGTSFAANYEGNVLGTLHLLDALKKFPPTRILLSSSCAVGLGSEELREEKLGRLPPREEPYSHTKALVESLLESSPHSCDIYRLGILVGDSRTGAIERSDGPYPFYRLMRNISRSLGRLGRIPFPVSANPGAPLPLVAVDEAASLFVSALFFESAQLEVARVRYWGAYRTDLFFGDWVNSCAKHLAQEGCRMDPVYLSRVSPRRWAIAGRLAGIPSEAMRFAAWRGRLHNARFTELHGADALSGWPALHDAFFRGGDFE